MITIREQVARGLERLGYLRVGDTPTAWGFAREGELVYVGRYGHLRLGRPTRDGEKETLTRRVTLRRHALNAGVSDVPSE